MSSISLMALTTAFWSYFVIVIVAATDAHSSVAKVFQNPDAQTVLPFQHMIVERQLYTGRVYVAGVDRLYQLSADLDLQVRVETGPFDDSTDCPAIRDKPCDATKQKMDNYNKALAIYAKQSKLIACGSLYQGSCRLHTLYNISNAEQPVQEAVVANDRDSSSVVFVAPGPPSLQDALYVASTYSGQGKFNDELPAVATRSLDSTNFLKIAHRTINSETQMFVESTLRKQYRIEYIYGFASGNYSYFVTRQPVHERSQYPYHTKLARLCHADQFYYSYTEVPLECEDYNLIQAAYLGKPGFDLARDLNVSVDDDVLYGVFAKSASENGGGLPSTPARQSALCVYSLKQIEEKFMDNIRLCASGSMNRGLNFFKQAKPCSKTSYASDYLACGNEVNYPLGGDMPIRRKAAYKTNSVRLSSVAATTTHMYTVVFMGTDDGNLKKAVVEKAEDAFEYDMITVDPGIPVLADMQFDMSGEYIYVMTIGQVAKVKVQECEQLYQKCSQCLGAKDPYCGWCSSDNKCSIQGSCNKQHWLPYKDAQCTTITRVTPDKLQVTTSAFVVLEIQNLQNIPQTGQLSCVFILNGRKSVTGAARTNDNSISCAAPETYLRHIPNGQNAIVSSLSVQVDNGPELASTNFTFYDCSTYKACHDCVSSEYPCDWCAETVTCTSNAEDSCRNQRIINGQTRPGLSVRKGPQYCPQITSVDSSPVVYVPSGTSKALSVKAVNLLEFQTKFTCQFEIGPSIHKRPSKRVEDRIECDPMDFTYFDLTPNDTAKFSVAWDEGKTLDNVENIRVVMYKCEKLASNCGLCLYLDQQYSCGWCAGTQSCTTEGRCKGSSWMDKTETCPGPKILNFYPQSGPLDGGTNVTIEGINLGRYFRDIENAVRINNVPCIPSERDYQPSTKIVCTTGPANHRKVQSGPIVVKLKDALDYYALSDPGFDYVDPVITGFSPTEGPQSGGTIITIFGENLNAGSTVKATVAGVQCEVIKREKDRAYCRSGASTVPNKEGGVEMSFDGAIRKYIQPHIRFVYSQDPAISLVFPKTSIVSGGIRIKVDGNRFHLIQNARIYFANNDGQEFASPCEIVKNDPPNTGTDVAPDLRRSTTTAPAYILCTTPPVPISPSDRMFPLVTRPLFVDYGFVFDGVVYNGGGNRNTTTTALGDKFSIFPDPTFNQFSKPGEQRPIKYFRGEYLSIDGENLELAFAKEDVEVYIGDQTCTVWTLGKTQLICKPPPEQPTRPDSSSPRISSSMAGFSSDGLPEVVVRVGGANFTLGYLSYEEPTVAGASGIRWETVGYITAALAAVIAVLILIGCVLYRRKSTRQRRQMNSLKEQIDAIELKVASECKEAFAELQTDMTEMTAAIDNFLVVIPFLSYRDYAVQVLFPNNMVNNPIDKQLEVDPHRRPTVEKGLRIFHTLLMNKNFLLTFIRTMEANKYFLSKDKVQVGSLLMVVLQERMEYCTDILKALLSELIGRTVERRYQPKVLFRRSECVAERMLATWFTFLMHRYLQECAGQPLFMLYWAIKQQVEKGPQDALVHEARYSLSEEKLIRQSIDFHALTVFVSGPELNTPEVSVRVLDCDTITQVKEKCLDAVYRTTPYSRRPSASDLELEWRTGVSGRLLLQDLDVTTKPEPGGWKKLNTLAHYKVPNNSSLAMVPKHSSLYNLSLSSEKSSVLSLKNSPTLSRTLSPLSIANHHHQKDPESGYKVYHLVKPSDDQQGHNSSSGERGSGKMVSEIYLTRLLTTKGTLQKFVEDLFEAIFSTAHRGTTLPICIKYMFDFMDEQAVLYGITDPDVVHTWKSNSLPLRFWVNLIKNPHFVFDIARPAKIEGCLSVVAQTLMDSCSTQDPQLTKDSPSSKLLFARDIHTYRDWVDRYYRDIQQVPSISDQDMNAFLADESRQHNGEFNLDPALFELYQYLDKYKDQIATALDEDETCRRTKLSSKFEQMVQTMQSAENGVLMTGTLPTYPSAPPSASANPMTSTLNQSIGRHGPLPPPYHQIYNQSSLR